MGREVHHKLEIFTPKRGVGTSIPLVSSSVAGGFPSPAEDYIEKRLDLNELLIDHPVATFYVRVEGDSMEGAGIFSGDILIVDRSLTASHGKIVVAVLNGEFTVKRFVRKGEGIVLQPENNRYKAIAVENEDDFQVWGVVTYVIHKTR